MTIHLPTIDFKSVQQFLVNDPNPHAEDLSKLDDKTLGVAAVKLLETRKATNPSDGDKIQKDIDAINSGQMSVAQVQQILSGASSDEIKDALFQTGYGITKAQFDQITSGDDISNEDLGKLGGIQGQTSAQVKNQLMRTKLGEQYGLTPNEIDELMSANGASRMQLLNKLGMTGQAEGINDALDSIKGNSAAKYELKINPMASQVSLGDFIGAIVAAIEAVLRGKNKTQQSDAQATQMRMQDVVNTAKDRISTMKSQAATQVEQLKGAIKQIKDAKIFQTIMTIAAYVITVIITAALMFAAVTATIATGGAAAPTIALAVVAGALIFGALTAFFILNLKDIQSSDGKNWMQRAADSRFGDDKNAKSAEEASQLRKEKQQYMSLLGSIQTIVDVVSAVLSLGASAAGSAATIAAQMAAKEVMRAIMQTIQEVIRLVIKNMVKMLSQLTKVIGMALMIGSGTVSAMMQSGQLQDSMAQGSDVMKGYKNKFSVDAANQRVAMMEKNPAFSSMSKEQIQAYANKEQELLNSGDTKALAELYAQRNAVQSGQATSFDLNNLDKGTTLAALNAPEQQKLTASASGYIHQRTVDSVNAYKTAISDFTEKNQGLMIGVQVGAAVAGMAGGGLTSPGAAAGKAEKEAMEEVTKAASKLAQQAGKFEEGAMEAAEEAAGSLTNAVSSVSKVEQKALKKAVEEGAEIGAETSTSTAARAERSQSKVSKGAMDESANSTLTLRQIDDTEKGAVHAIEEGAEIGAETSTSTAARAERSQSKVSKGAVDESANSTLTLRQIDDTEKGAVDATEQAAGPLTSALSPVSNTEQKTLKKAVEEGAQPGSDLSTASKAERYQKTAMLVQTTLGGIQAIMQSGGEIYKAEMDRETIKKKLEINEKMRHFQLMLTLQNLSVDVLNQLKEDMFAIEESAVNSSKSIGQAIQSIWKGLEAGLDAAAGSKK